MAPHRRHQEAVLHERRNDAPPEAVGVAHARQSIKRHRRSRAAYQAQGRIQKPMEWHTASQDQTPQKSPCMISRGASPIAEGGGTDAPSTPDIATLLVDVTRPSRGKVPYAVAGPPGWHLASARLGVDWQLSLQTLPRVAHISKSITPGHFSDAALSDGDAY